MSESEFEKELRQLENLYHRERKELLKKYKGLYAAYCMNELMAIGKTYDEAVAKAWEKKRHVPIFVEKVMPEGEEETWLMV
ncbi:MAG: DUF5678 domain-containing protein [Candidatus Helarchaeota archaeon]